MDNTRYCNFCGKSEHEVINLIAAPSVFICDECVIICAELILEKHKKWYRKLLKVILDFGYK